MSTSFGKRMQRGAVRLLSCGVVIAAWLTACDGPTTPSGITVAISPDLPPYVMDHATRGIEVDLVRTLLAPQSIHFVQMPYAELQTAVPDGRADVALGVQRFTDDHVHYSVDCLIFENVAITKESAGLEIESIGDLAGHRVLAWQDAHLELGPEFEKLFAPSSRGSQPYVEIGNQREQVEAFWSASDAVVVIDRNVFRAFSEELGHAMDGLAVHRIFRPTTRFRAGFVDPALRDTFDRGVASLCANGGYVRILDRYQADPALAPCAP